MAAFQKFNSFVEALAERKHNLGSDVLKVYLTNVSPNGASMSLKADLTEITSTDGYTTGGNECTVSSSSQTSGIYKLVLNDPATWTSTGTIGPFRWAVLYNSTNTDKELIGYWDYGSSVTLATGETFKVDFSATTGVLTIQ